MHKSVFQFSKKMEEKKENMKRRYEDSVTIFERKKIIEKERLWQTSRSLPIKSKRLDEM